MDRYSWFYVVAVVYAGLQVFDSLSVVFEGLLAVAFPLSMFILLPLKNPWFVLNLVILMISWKVHRYVQIIAFLFVFHYFLNIYLNTTSVALVSVMFPLTIIGIAFTALRANIAIHSSKMAKKSVS